MDDRFPIIRPAREEIDQAVEAILSEGVPPRTTLRAQLKAASGLPLSTLFFGVGDALFLAALLALLCLVPAAVVVAQSGHMASLLFLLSPALYAALQLLTWWKEFLTGTLEWKQTCRISFRALAALRMLLFGGVSVLVCVPVNLLFWALTEQQFSLPWMLGLSFSSLFLYAALDLSWQSGRLAPLAAPAIWGMVGALLLRWRSAALLLTKVPAVLFFLLAGVGLYRLLWKIKRDLLHPAEGGICYAVR